MIAEVVVVTFILFFAFVMSFIAKNRNYKIKLNYCNENVIIFKKVKIELDSRALTVDGKMVSLTFTEFETLKLLACNPGKVHTRADILNNIKGKKYSLKERKESIVGLRKKLGSYGSCIKTVRGVGYKFLVEE